jgi:Na+/H+-dicarboxylate symporter
MSSDFTDGICDEGDTTCIYIYTFSIIAVAIAFIVFACYRPLVGTGGGQKKQIESILLAIFVPPIYTMIYGYQNPISEGSEILTAVIALFFPFIVFCIPYKINQVKPVTQSGDWV